ncbi:Double-stranded RNA-binding protein 1 [Linum grandiflorum]
MSKSALNELCQRQRWSVPVYSTTRHGAVHAPRFHATVTVNGADFAPESYATSVKGAESDAAGVALQHLSAVAAQAPPRPPLGIQHLYKRKLQSYAQRRKLLLPEYAVERDGPVHASRFSCTVTIGGQTYRSEGFLPTLKDAENSAAKVALAELQPDGTAEEEALYKSLLQERAQRGGGVSPVYETRILGEVQSPIFISTVSLGDRVFHGLTAKSKKLAERSAAKVAYTSLIQGSSIQTTVQEPVLPALNTSSARLAQHPYVPFPPSMAKKQNGMYMGSSSGTKTQPPNYVLLEHLHQQIPNELKGPGFDSNTASFQLSARTSSILNEKTAEKPPTIPSLLYRNELMTGMDPGLGIDSSIAKRRALSPVGPVSFPIRVPQQTPITPSQITHAAVPSGYQSPGNLMTNGTQPPVIQPSSVCDGILVNPAAFPPVDPVFMSIAPAPMRKDITSRVHCLIGTNIQPGDRIVVHSRDVSVTCPNGSDVLPISDEYWMAVRCPVSQPPREIEQA